MAAETLNQFAKDIPTQKPTKLKLRRTLKGHLAKVYAFEWHTNSRYIVSASQDGKLLVWDALTGNKLEVISLRSSWVMTCAFSPSGNFVACGGLDNTTYIYHIKGKDPPTNPVRELSGHQGFVGCVRFLDDKRVVSASGDHTNALWDIETGQLVTEFKEHKGEVMCVAVHPTDKNQFLSAASDCFVKLWDARSSKSVYSVKAHERDVNWVTYFPNGQGFGSASDDETCRLHDLRANAELQKFGEVGCPVTSLSFSKGGQYLFAGQEDCSVTVWDTLKAEKFYNISAHQSRISAVGVAPDGMALCTAGWDSELKIWA